MSLMQERIANAKAKEQQLLKAKGVNKAVSKGERNGLRNVSLINDMVKKTKIILLSILAIFIGVFFNHFTYYFLLEKSDGIYKLINCLEKVTSSP